MDQLLTGRFFIALGEHLDAQALFLILVMLLVMRAFGRVVSDPENSVRLHQFFSSPDALGVEKGDANKFGIMVGIVGSTLMIGYMFWSHKAVEYTWVMVALFALWLAAIFGATSFAKWIRTFLESRVGKVNVPGAAPSADSAVTK
jgi:uncharacterized membrane protein